MTATVTTAGLSIQTFEQIFEEVLASTQEGLELTDAQAARLRANLQSSLGNFLRIIAEREAADQEALLKVFNVLSWYAEGVALDNVCSLVGVTRLAAASSTATLTITGTAGEDVDAATRLQYNPTGDVWVVDATTTIGAGGTAQAAVTAEASGAVELGAAASGDWTLLTSNPEVSAVATVEQTLIGRDRETDGELRLRASTEAYKRGQGPIAAITGRIQEIKGVTFVRGFESQAVSAHETDADGIPARSINYVVRGGSSDAIAETLTLAKAAGVYLHAEPGPTYVERTVTLSNGSPYVARFNRDEEVTVWIRYTATTSTSEVDATPNLIAEIDALLAEKVPGLFDIGADVLPSKIEAIVQASDSGIVGVDDFEVELSLDDGATDPYTRARRVMSFRQAAAFDSSRISGTEA